MTKISIIIPVYNVEKYLPQCLDSLINQTLKDIEFICINDGSTDNSLDILQQYAAGDPRFKIINQTNHGQGYARNRGIEIANGEYIGFVDPDDWIELDMYEKLYNIAKKYHTDIAECNYIKEAEKPQTPSSENISQILSFSTEPLQNNIYNWQLLPPRLLFDFTKVVWNKIYKASFISKENIRFSPGRCSEDNLFMMHCRLCAKSIVQNHKYLYHYRIRSGSASNLSTNRLDFIDVIKDIRKLLLSNKQFQYNKEAYYKYLLFKFQNLYPTVCEQHQKLFKQQFLEILPSVYHSYLDDNMLPQSINWKDKLFSIKKVYKLTNQQEKGIIKTYIIIRILGLKIKLESKKKSLE